MHAIMIGRMTRAQRLGCQSVWHGHVIFHSPGVGNPRGHDILPWLAELHAGTKHLLTSCTGHLQPEFPFESFHEEQGGCKKNVSWRI